ncbi:MAG: hypothetical protein ACRDJO_05375 [Actinomycetota bacterium]
MASPPVQGSTPGGVCCRCGRLLVRAVGERSILSTAGDEIPFSRSTDHVLCPECLRSYPARGLRIARPTHDSVNSLGRLVEMEYVAEGLLEEYRRDGGVG